MAVMNLQHTVDLRWQQAIEAGLLDAWDLRPELETVHHSPQWKIRLGYPEPQSADSTHFWRCRVHPDDLEPMLQAMRAHFQGQADCYIAQFRIRSNGSGYRTVHSRGRVIERSAEGRVARMVGTMIDLTPRPPSPRTGLAEGPRGAMEGWPLLLPFHALLADFERSDLVVTDTMRTRIDAERERVLHKVADLLHAAVAQLEVAPAE